MACLATDGAGSAAGFTAREVTASFEETKRGFLPAGAELTLQKTMTEEGSASVKGKGKQRTGYCDKPARLAAAIQESSWLSARI